MRASAPWRETEVSTKTLYILIGVFTFGYPLMMILIGAWMQKVWGIF